MDELDKFVAENIKAEIKRVSVECITTGSVEMAEVMAMLDTKDIQGCVQAVCIGFDCENIRDQLKSAVDAAIGMVAENNLITKFEQGEK